MNEEEKILIKNLSKWVDEGMGVYLSFLSSPAAKAVQEYNDSLSEQERYVFKTKFLGIFLTELSNKIESKL